MNILFFYGYEEPSKVLLNILKPVKYIHLKHEHKTSSIYYEAFEDEGSEIVFLANRISQLLNNHVPHHKIKIHVTNDDDLSLISNIFNRFNIATHRLQGYKLSQLDFIDDIIHDDILHMESITESLNCIIEKLDKRLNYGSPQGSQIYKAFLSVLNPYIVLEGKLIDYKSQLLYDFSNTYVHYPKMHPSVMIGDILDQYIPEDNHVFIVGVNANEIPKQFQNNTYLDDSLRKKLDLPTSLDLAKKEKKAIDAFLNQTEFLYLTSKNTRQGQRLYPSQILDEIKRSVQAFDTLDDSNRFSLQQDLIDVSKYHYIYETYQIKHKDLELLYAHLNQDMLKPYDNQLKTLDDTITSVLLSKKNHLSYTNLKTYFECPFKFLFQHLLKVGPYEDTNFSLLLGNFFHEVLKDYQQLPNEKENLEGILEEKLNQYIDTHQVTNLEKIFFLKKSLLQLSEVIQFLKDIDSGSTLDSIETEKKIEFPIEGTYINKLTGFIDKIVASDPKFEHYYIVDYKSGSSKHSLDYIESGLYAQLMFYLMFLRNQYSDSKVLGFYHQNIFSKVKNKEKDKTYVELLRKEYQLYGYSHEDITLMQRVDSNILNSNKLAKYTIKKDGTHSKYAWIFSSDILDQTITDFEALILETVKKIEAGQFPVEPLYLNGDLKEKIACKYCNFKDICYVKNNNYKNAPKHDPLMSGDETDEYTE